MGEMSILDDAIREHLELKRAHGADESEVKRLEDEAFGPAERPGASSDVIDPFAEAPTEFLTAPGAPTEPGSAERRLPNIADLQEPPPAKPAEAEGADDAAAGMPSGEADFTDTEASVPVAEEQEASEHQIIAEPAPQDRPSPPSDKLVPDPGAPGAEVPAEEREAIAEQPTEMFDVEQQLFEDTAQSASPSDEQLIDAERTEPRITPTPDDEPADEFDEFFSEQRLSDELNQALDTPLDDEPSLLPSTEEALAGIPPLPSELDDPPAPAADPEPPATDEAPSPFLDPDAELGPPPPAPEPDSAELPELPLDRTVEQRLPDDAHGEDDIADEFQPGEPGHVDALEDTPEFLEDAPEDEDAWFEQKPPKDFDFGD
jgi:hypothetical protein